MSKRDFSSSHFLFSSCVSGSRFTLSDTVDQTLNVSVTCYLFCATKRFFCQHTDSFIPHSFISRRSRYLKKPNYFRLLVRPHIYIVLYLHQSWLTFSLLLLVSKLNTFSEMSYKKIHIISLLLRARYLTPIYFIDVSMVLCLDILSIFYYIDLYLSSIHLMKTIHFVFLSFSLSLFLSQDPISMLCLSPGLSLVSVTKRILCPFAPFSPRKTYISCRRGELPKLFVMQDSLSWMYLNTLDRQSVSMGE